MVFCRQTRVFCLAETRTSSELEGQWLCQFWPDLGLIYGASESLHGYVLWGNGCKVTLSNWELDSCKGRGVVKWACVLVHAEGSLAFKKMRTIFIIIMNERSSADQVAGPAQISISQVSLNHWAVLV